MIAQGLQLGDVVAPRNEKASPADHPQLPYIGLEHIEAHSTHLLGTASTAKMRSSAKRFYKDDVLYSRLRPYLNKVWRADREGLCSSEFIVLPGNKDVDADFLRYRLNALDFVTFANSLNAGDRPRVNFKQISSFILPPFSLARQRRIVEKIESLFARLDKGEAALRQVQTLLKRYRQSVLKAAVTGELTRDWRAQNAHRLESGADLLERILATRRDSWQGRGKYKEPAAPDTTDLPQLPEGWVWASVEQISQSVDYGSSDKSSPDIDGVPVLRMGNIVEGRLQTKELKYLPFDYPKFPKLLLEEGDLLFNRTNSAELVGKTAVYHGELEPCSFVSYLIRVRLLEIDSDFVAAYINSVHGRQWINSVVSQQVGQANVNGSKLKALKVPLPSVAEQKEIDDRLNTELSGLETAEAACQTELARSQSLRQSILKQAFSGQLVPQDPNDEPASRLLARIRAERETGQTRSKAKRRGKGGRPS